MSKLIKKERLQINRVKNTNKKPLSVAKLPLVKCYKLEIENLNSAKSEPIPETSANVNTVFSYLFDDFDYNRTLFSFLLYWCFFVLPFLKLSREHGYRPLYLSLFNSSKYLMNRNHAADKYKTNKQIEAKSITATKTDQQKIDIKLNVLNSPDSLKDKGTVDFFFMF